MAWCREGSNRFRCSRRTRKLGVAATVAAATGASDDRSQGTDEHYGDKHAVEKLSSTVRPGVVTGFLGPNGSGKSTTMRMIMGLDAPTAGDVTVKGKHFKNLQWPLREVGALLEAKAIHPGRSARAHLTMLAQTNHIPSSRVDELLELVGLTPVAGKRAGKFSLGMDNDSASRRRSLVTPRSCCSTSRSTGSTPTAFDGFVTC